MHEFLQTIREKHNLPPVLPKNIQIAEALFHDPRHTAASLMLNNGISLLVVSKILGHSNPSAPLSIYAHSTFDMQSTVASIMDGIVTPIPVYVPQLHPIAPDD